MRARAGIALFAAVLAFASCSNLPTRPGRGRSPAAPAHSLAELAAAPDSLSIDGRSYDATAFAWRNYQPIEPDTRLNASIRLRSAQPDTIPGTVVPRYIWVIHDAETWGAELQFRYQSVNPVYVQAGAFGGPEWPVGDSIRVVAGIKDSGGTIRLLRCPDGVIYRTD